MFCTFKWEVKKKVKKKCYNEGLWRSVIGRSISLNDVTILETENIETSFLSHDEYKWFFFLTFFNIFNFIKQILKVFRQRERFKRINLY